jgi:hypothetical protein
MANCQHTALLPACGYTEVSEADHIKHSAISTAGHIRGPAYEGSTQPPLPVMSPMKNGGALRINQGESGDECSPVKAVVIA